MPLKIYQDQILDYQDFSGKCLIGLKFINCSLRFCNFKDSDLSYSIFESCDLYNTLFNKANFYFTRITNCDATKAIFVDAYLNGIRIKDTVITYSEFGEEFKTHKERKSLKSIDDVTEDYLKVGSDSFIPDIFQLENSYKGIFVLNSNIAIEFLDNSEDIWRIWRRKSEIALTIKKILEENGYKDKSLHYYFLHRRFLRKSKRNFFYRFVDFIGNELFWGYGVKLSNPVLAFFANCFLFSIFYTFFPMFVTGSGMKMSNNIVNVFHCHGFDIVEYIKVLYGSFLISTLSVFGDIDIVGYARIFVVLHVGISVLLLGLGVAALSKKLANA